MNRVKDLLNLGETVIGTAASPFVDNVTMLADCGFDFLLFDTQHHPLETKQLDPSIQAMHGKKTLPIIRVSSNSPDLICFALDIGAKGIIVPTVNSKEEVITMLQACKYPPLGNRSSAGIRGEWSENKDYRDYMDKINEELLIIPMIETQKAIDNLEDILSVHGIDVLLVGPSDLSIELGVPVNYSSEIFLQALDKIVDSCKKSRVVPGMYFIPPYGGYVEEVFSTKMDYAFYIDKGFRFFTVPWTQWVMNHD